MTIRRMSIWSRMRSPFNKTRIMSSRESLSRRSRLARRKEKMRTRIASRTTRTKEIKCWL